jgi:hypothetical protein
MISTDLFNSLVFSWIAIGVLIFPVLNRITVPYGRHTKSGWGPMIDNRLGWIIMELPALVIFSWFVLAGKNSANQMILIFFAFWFIHYFNRAIIFPFRIRTSKKKMPLLIMGSAVFFNLINGFLNGYWFGVLSDGYPEDWAGDPRFIGGAVVFAAGFVINQYHDKILISLRKNSNGEYKIPHGGLFRVISCPNFFGEIIEWGGFALMTWCLPSLSFFVWTFVNLVPRALDHHRWYRQYFENYPKERKAVLPYIL